MFRKKLFLYSALSIIMVVVFLLSACDGIEMKKDKVLCGARSVSTTISGVDELTLDIPPNVGITKIYGSVIMDVDPLNNVLLLIEDLETNEIIFRQRYMVDELIGRREFETTLVQPLCIGPQGAELSLSPLNNQVSVEVFFLTSTVVFCPDYCTE